MAHVETFVHSRSLPDSLSFSHTLINKLMRNKNKINEVIVKIARVFFFLAKNIISPHSGRSAHSRRNLKKESSNRNAQDIFSFFFFFFFCQNDC